MNESPFFSVTIVVLITIVIWKIFSRKAVDIHPDQYLEVLSFTEWKQGRDIVKELEQKHNTSLGYAKFYITMRYLEDEELIMKRVFHDEDGAVAEFRKKAGGRRKEEFENTSPSLVPKPA